MAVGVLITMPGVTQEQYEQVNRKMFGRYPMELGDAPAGLILHSAGPGPDAWHVYDIWESREAHQRFSRDKVGPAVQAIIGAEPGSGPPPQYFEVASLIHVPSDAAFHEFHD